MKLSNTTLVNEANWLLTAVTNVGAIQQYPDVPANKINCYLAGYAVMGLCRAYEWTGTTTYLTAAVNHLNWQVTNNNPLNGRPTDWTWNGSTWINTNDSDAFDSSGALLLLAEWYYCHAAQVVPTGLHLLAIDRAVNNLLALIAASTNGGWPQAKPPGFSTALLWDTVEVYGGLLAAAQLYTLRGDATSAAPCTAAAVKLAANIGTRWNAALSSYAFAVNNANVPQAAVLSNAFPDCDALAATIAFGAARTGDIAAAMAAMQAAGFAKWDDWDAVVNIAGSAGTMTYQGIWMAMAMNITDPNRARTGADAIEGGALLHNRAWTYSVGESGRLILAATGGLGVTKQPAFAFPLA